MKKTIIFVCITLLAVFLRFWQLAVVPVSPDWDEAALGYNAYSILKTGRDEYGTILPRALRSYDDYKPPLYMYLAVPSIAVFGLNTWATRLPSAVMGVLAVVGTYFLVAFLWRDKGRSTKGYTQALPFLAMFLLAISPWHLQFSRIAFEANTGITLNIWGLVTLFWGLTSFPHLLLSAFLFGLSLYAYHSERVFVPLLLFIVAVLWRKELFSDRRKISIAIVVGLLTVTPLLPVVLDTTSVTRLKGTSSLSDTTGLLMRSVSKLTDDQKAGNNLGAIFDNRRIVYAKTLLDGYMSHFSLRWLFLVGDNDRHHAPDNGLLYLWELPFILWGIYAVWRGGGRSSRLLFGWALIAPIAASPTSETPHAIRTLVMLPIFQIFTAFGILEIASLVQNGIRAANGLKKHIYSLGAIFCFLFMVGNTIFYFHMYYAHLNYEYSKFWQYGYAQVVKYAEMHKAKYNKIVVSTALEQPHMFFLFYTKYDPAKYLASGGTSSGGFAEVRNRFDTYEFRPISNWWKELHDGSTLYIGSPSELPGDAYTIKYLNGEDAMRISE